MVIVAAVSLLASDSSMSTIKPTNDASSSVDAIILNGSPRMNAQGAVALVSSTENHDASAALSDSRMRQPPTRHREVPRMVARIPMGLQ